SPINPVNGLLSASRHLDEPTERIYRNLWRVKSAIARIQQQRQQSLVQSRDPNVQELAQRLRDTRRNLARLLLAPGPLRPADAKRLQKLTDDKEDQERELAALVPLLKRYHDLDQLHP